MFNSVRARLTGWYVLVFGLLLGSFSVFLYALLSKDLYRRFDEALSATAVITANFLRGEIAENGGNVAAGSAETLAELMVPGTRLAIFEGDRTLASNHPDIPLVVKSAGLLRQAKASGAPVFITIRAGGARIVVMPAGVPGADCFVAAMQPLDSVVNQLGALQRMFCIALPATLLLAGMGGFFLAKKSLAPVLAMSNQAQRISAENLHERLPVRDATDELGRLAEVFNELLARLQRSFESMRSFMADASHELRTPLAIIRSEADVALSRDRAATEYKESLAIIQDEERRLSRLVENMFDLARADAGHRPLEVEEFYLNDLVEDCCRAAQALIREKQLVLSFNSSKDIPFRGDQALIHQMTLNLLDNAIRYTPSGGSVSVKLVRGDGDVSIVVSDTGIGIPAESTGRVFERFYRVDKARSRAAGGSGLGLAIVKWVAEAHKGSVNLTSDIGRGSTFTVLLPLEAVSLP